MTRGKDYWFVTRPKRKLNSIPEVLAAFCTVALDNQWSGNRKLHIAFEEELEKTGTKRIGERRDASGSGGRTHAAMLFGLGLWFEKDKKVYLTLAGEAIMNGKPIIAIEVKNSKVIQAREDHNKEVNDEWIKLIKKWAKLKGFAYGV